MADDEDIAALVIDNGSGMCKGTMQICCNDRIWRGAYLWVFGMASCYFCVFAPTAWPPWPFAYNLRVMKWCLPVCRWSEWRQEHEWKTIILACLHRFVVRMMRSLLFLLSFLFKCYRTMLFFLLQICCEINRYCYRPTFNTLFLSCLYQQPDLLEMMLLDPFSLLSLDAPVSQVSWWVNNVVRRRRIPSVPGRLEIVFPRVIEL